MNNILVSVIITTYRRNDFLIKAIESVINQTYKNLEIIIVDDNNPDDEYRVKNKMNMLNYLKKDPRIKYIEMEMNSGACAARNKGFQASKGSFVNFLDDDDFFYKDKIELQLRKTKKLPGNTIVGCYANICDRNGNIYDTLRPRIKGNIFFQQLCYGMIATPIPLIKRELFLKSGGFENIPSCQEHLFFSKLFSVSPFYDYVDKELVGITHHDDVRISNFKNKPKGSMELSIQLKRFYNRLTNDQIKKLELEMSFNLISSYIAVNEKKKALIVLLDQIKKSKKIRLYTAKILFIILLGDSIKVKFKKFMNLLHIIQKHI